jgi:nucleoside 2-deoxyribosyltransferase
MPIYLAGGLFNAGERLHNLYLEKHLKAFGYDIISPQRRALNFLKDERFDTEAIVADCATISADKDALHVGCIDGTDGDSGECIELGIAVTATGRAIIYRTDFRTAENHEVGVNAMYKLKGVLYIYHPCYITEFNQIDVYYHELAKKIHEAITAISLWE